MEYILLIIVFIIINFLSINLIIGYYMGKAIDTLNEMTDSIGSALAGLLQRIIDLKNSESELTSEVSNITSQVTDLRSQIEILNTDKSDMATADEITTALQPIVDKINSL